MLITVPNFNENQARFCVSSTDGQERTLLHKGEWVHGTSHPIQRMSYLHDIMGKVCPYPFYQYFRKRCAVPRSRVQSSKPG